MARATKAEKARLLNAAYRLLGQRMEGGTRDVRFVKDGVARALRTLRAAARRPEDQLVPLSPQMVGLQFAAAARAGRSRARLPPSVSVGAAPRENPARPRGRTLADAPSAPARARFPDERPPI